MTNHTTLYALIAGYGFGACSTAFGAALYEPGPGVMMAVALFSFLFILLGIGLNEWHRRRAR